MKMSGYFIASSGEDGTTIQGPLSVDEVKERITPDKDGYSYYGENVKFLDHVPDSDKGYWHCDDGEILILKGEIVIPKTKEMVTRFCIE